MPTTNGSISGTDKQSAPPDSCQETARRLRTIQSDLIGIAGAFGMSRSLLDRRGPWDEAARDPREYEPYRPFMKEQEMIRDVVRNVARRGDTKDQAAVRKAVKHYFETRCEDALEMLGTQSEWDVIALALDSKREISEADCAVTMALTSGTPENFERAAREGSEALSTLERLRDRCLEMARSKFFTPRTTRLFAAR